MASTDPVIASIDGALRDCDTSEDAMRWNPDLERARPGAVRLYNPYAFAEMAEAAGLMSAAWQRRIIKQMASVSTRLALAGHRLTLAFAGRSEIDPAQAPPPLCDLQPGREPAAARLPRRLRHDRVPAQDESEAAQ